MTNAIGYARVSDEDQVEGLSLDAQRREIARYCEQRGYTLVNIYTDEGKSAHTDLISKRPAFAALLEAAERHECDVVVVHTLDRWARRISVQAQALERLGRADVGFASVMENVDFTTPAGRLMLTVMGGVAEFYSDQLGVHVKKSKREAFEVGLPVGPLPLGYVYVAGQAIVARVLADVVVEMFVRRISGQSYNDIAAAMNEAGHRTKPGATFTSFAVRDILRNPFYTGVVTHHGEEHEGRHEAIVDRATFERVQGLRHERRPARRHAVVTGGLLTGRIRCNRCRRRLWGDRRPSGASRYREQHQQPCANVGRSVDAAWIDGQLGDIFSALRVDEEMMRETLASVAGTRTDEAAVKALQEQRRRLARAYGDGGYTEAEYIARRDAIDAKMRSTVETPALDIEAVAALLRDLPSLWKRATLEERRQLVGVLIEEVHVDVDEQRVAGIVALPGFDKMLSEAVSVAEAADLHLHRGPDGESDTPGEGGVWWRRGSTSLPSDPTPRRWAVLWKDAA